MNPYVDLFCQQVGDDRSERGEERGEKDAHIPDVHGEVDEPQQAVERGRGDHQAGIDGAADDPSQGIPGALIEPVVKVVETLLGQEPRGAVVKVRVKLMDDTLEAQHGEEPSAEGCNWVPRV